MQMSRRRRLVAVGCVLLVAVAVLAILVPHPLVWTRVWAEPEYPRAIFAALRIASRIRRPSGVSFNGVTYTFLIRNVSREDIEVVFLPRIELRGHLFTESAEEIHVVVRKPAMQLVRWRFAE